MIRLGLGRDPERPGATCTARASGDGCPGRETAAKTNRRDGLSRHGSARPPLRGQDSGAEREQLYRADPLEHTPGRDTDAEQRRKPPTVTDRLGLPDQERHRAG